MENVQQWLALLHSLRLKKAQALLLYLISSPGRFYRNEMVSSLLWSKSDSKKTSDSFRQTIRQIRVQGEAYAGFLLTTHNGTIGFGKKSDGGFEESLSQQLLQSQCSAASMHDVRSFLQLLETLVGLSDPYDTWLMFLRTQVLNNVEKALDKLIDENTGSTGLTVASFAVELEPHNENATRFIMRDLWQSGSATRAISVYNDLYEHLGETFDQEPESETMALLAAIKMDPEGHHSNMVRGPAKPRITLQIKESERPKTTPREASLQAVLVSDLRTRLSRFREWEVLSPDHQHKPYLVVKADLHSIGEDHRLGVDVHQPDRGTVIWSEMIDAPSVNWDQKVRLLLVNIANALRIVVTDRKQTDASAIVYDKWLASQTLIGTWKRDDEEKAISLLHEVTNSAPDFGPAHAELAGILNVRHILRPGTRHTEDAMLMALDHAVEAVATDPMETRAHRVLAWCYCHSRKHNMAEFHFEQSLLLNPQNPLTLASAALGFAFSENLERARQLIDEVSGLPKAMEPFHLVYLAASNYLCGNYAVASEQCAQGQDLMSTVGGWHTAALWQMGHEDAARRRLLEYTTEIAELWCGNEPASPEAVVDWFVSCFPLQSEEVRGALRNVLRRALASL